MIIDPPSDFAPLADWQLFLDDMLSLAKKLPDDSEVEEWLLTAKAGVAQRETK